MVNLLRRLPTVFRPLCLHRPAAARPLPCLQALLCAVALLGVAGCEVARSGDPTSDQTPPDPVLSITAGEDYDLPAWVSAEPFSGYVNHPLRGDPSIGGGQRSLWARWINLEPERGEYDWSSIESALDAAEAGGFQISLHILSNVRGGGAPDRGIVVNNVVPEWVITDFALAESDIVNLGWEFNMQVIPAWRPEIRAAFEDLIRAFGERGLPHRPGLGSAYVHGISPSQGEEFWLTGTNIHHLEQQAGLTADLLEDWLSSRLQAYAEAFGSEAYKLAWVGVYDHWRYVAPAYTAVALRLIHRAWELGIGTRQGIVEAYHRSVNEPAFGQAVDANGYLTIDETIPPVATLRYFGNENEEYGDAWVFRYGDRAGEPQRYRFAMLRSLQMRLRFLWTSAAAEQINPPLSEYARLSFGKTVENSPDAWVYLSESPAGTHWSPVGALKNFERWLLQRDVPGGMTVPAERVDRYFDSGAVPMGRTDLWYDHVARRTDLADGNAHIYFVLDPRFAVAGRVQVKVEYRDDGIAWWRLEHLAGDGSLVSTPTVRNRGDGAVKTATFTLDDTRFDRGLEHGMDFRIVCDGPGDVTVRWVRLIRGV